MGLFLRPVAAGFGWGVALRRMAYRRGWFRVRRLATPVVSIGNLTVGGTGKTPLLAFTARKLAARGWKPGILTRGYGRQSPSPCVVLEPAPGRQPDPRESGDEPALLARKLPTVPIVVSADRHKGGRLAEERFPVDVLLLDDGFQHLALARDVDIVLVDATEEYSAQSLLPAGRLREPYSALERAHLIVLTRLELGAAPGLEDFVRGMNPRAKVFHCSTRLSGLRDISSGENIPLESVLARPVAAFCGVGNPEAFFADLTKWGFHPVDQMRFGDHHVYDRKDVEWLARRAHEKHARAMITTEKDAMNLPSRLESQIPILSCGIEAEIEEPAAFVEAIVSRLGPRQSGASHTRNSQRAAGQGFLPGCS
jgi:tetraacyldisaccharide 4'-kinase